MWQLKHLVYLCLLLLMLISVAVSRIDETNNQRNKKDLAKPTKGHSREHPDKIDSLRSPQRKNFRGNSYDFQLGHSSNVCMQLKCKRRQVCIVDNTTGSPMCIGRKLYLRYRNADRKTRQKLLKKFREKKNRRRVGHLSGNTDSAAQLEKKARRMKKKAQEFQQQRKRQNQERIQTLINDFKKRTTHDRGHNNTVHGERCRRKELNGLGQKLLDWFKQQQEEANRRKHKKQKRNSTKKELHEDDECRCLATISWKFQQLDADVDGHLSSRELERLNMATVAKQPCIAAFVKTCDHDRNGALTEKEWCCCFADVLPPCVAAMKMVPSVLIRGQPMLAPGAFVPQCDDDGFYKPVQCSASTGHCWCVDHNGHRLNGTRSTLGEPKC